MLNNPALSIHNAPQSLSDLPAEHQTHTQPNPCVRLSLPSCRVLPVARFDPTSVYVCNLRSNVTERELAAAFSTCGEVSSAVIGTNKRGESKGWAFVTFTSDVRTGSGARYCCGHVTVCACQTAVTARCGVVWCDAVLVRLCAAVGASGVGHGWP